MQKNIVMAKFYGIIKMYKIKEEILMKEATGELNMTVVTIIAIGAIIAFFWFMWPQIKNTISRQWNNVGSQECVDKDKDGNCD